MSDGEAQARLDNYLAHMLEAAQLARRYVQASLTACQESPPCVRWCAELPVSI
jgi:hypothetical protein